MCSFLAKEARRAECSEFLISRVGALTSCQRRSGECESRSGLFIYLFIYLFFKGDWSARFALVGWLVS